MDPGPESSEFVSRMWVQCENESCLKWRLLSPEAAARVEHSEPWYCFMNADSSHNSCSVSEETFPAESQFLDNGYKIVYSQLPLGSLVLVKLQNWPSWPGILCPDPFKRKYVTYDQDGNVEKYHIEFLGDPHSRAWISAKFVGYYSLSLKAAAECRKKKRWYRSALAEACQLYRHSPEQRLQVCCLSNQDRTKAGAKAAVVAKKRMQVSKNNTEKKKPKVRKRKRNADLKYSVENVCSDEALSKENMVVCETEGLLKELEQMLQHAQEPTSTGEAGRAQLSQCSPETPTGSPFHSYHEEYCFVTDETGLKAGECIEHITNNLKKIDALISEF
ncbi:zinc finger CW-type PWWP domain protein 2 isoform X1 [Mesocricetus auratus]|uniref:Zinc finger CW-type PWWP domain protein 2 isoform X1 n=1 Tax=Mesocricetus auratus TaxID=10036 RepID=A0ABM2X611_MESAU|nr:zinc finger CW-type PWWP domain protein 2 isoform X1 [Mesocricetus auratus]XP_040596279.1 zinc finger CW-type PWWP domain protein 2 isoform X1 [Mesocricetus auratus]